MLTADQKQEIISTVLQNATVKEFTKCELIYTVDNIEIILETTLNWIDEVVKREMSDFTDIEARKELGIKLLSMIIQERMEK